MEHCAVSIFITPFFFKVRTKEDVLCCVDAEGTLHVKPGLNSLFYAVMEANLYDINQIFLENGVHDEQGEYVVIDFPVTIIGERRMKKQH